MNPWTLTFDTQTSKRFGDYLEKVLKGVVFFFLHCTAQFFFSHAHIQLVNGSSCQPHIDRHRGETSRGQLPQGLIVAQLQFLFLEFTDCHT